MDPDTIFTLILGFVCIVIMAIIIFEGDNK